MTDAEQAEAVLDGLGGGMTVGNVHLTDEQLSSISYDIGSRSCTAKTWDSKQLEWRGQALFARHCGVRMLRLFRYEITIRGGFQPVRTLKKKYLICSVCGEQRK